MKFIDLRSDTVTMPTTQMREAMANAIVGDDVYEDDPTVKELEELAATMTGKEAALFCPSGTMANQLAVMVFTKRGDEVILGKNSHIVVHEVGGAAVLSGVSYNMVDNPDDTISGADVAARVRVPDVHHPDTGLVCLENALANGTVVTLETMRDAYDAAKKHNLPVHLDGARIFNASTHLGCTAADIAQYCDSLMFCISKGLAAPVGSLLCGSADFINKAKRYRKLLGGGMRQAGVLAAAGLIALNDMTKRLHIDHENAQYLGRELAKIPNISIDQSRIHINLVFFAVDTPGFDHDGFVADMLARGIKINGIEAGLYRFVPHNDVSREDLDYALTVVKELLGS